MIPEVNFIDIKIFNILLLQYIIFAEDKEISEMCDSDGEVSSNSLGHSQSRLTPEMQKLRTRNIYNGFSESESENSSTATTPRAKSSPSPRIGFPVQLHESPRPQANGFVPTFTVSPRKPRQSPRTTCSLDNVDLWEDNSDVDDGTKEDTKTGEEENIFDSINGVIINPSKTFDLSDLRRSRSPVACKRNKLMMTGDSDQRESNRAKSRSGSRDKKNVMSRARLVRRHNNKLKVPSSVKPKITLKSASLKEEEHGAKPDETENETGNQRLLPQRQPRLAAKFPTKIPVHKGVFSSKKDISKMVKQSSNSSKPSSCDTYNLRSQNVGSDKVKSAATGSSKLPFPLIEECNILPATGQKEDDKGKDKNKNTVTENIPNKVPKPPSYGTPPSRKVKFNSFVTVREDELNTLDYLKHSNDSAKLFKNKYLRGTNTLSDMGSCNQEGHENDLMIQTIG